MKIARTFLILSLCFLIYSTPLAHAQEEQSAAWQVTKFEITVNAAPNERALTAHALLTARNIGRGSGSTFSLRISPKVEIKTVTDNYTTTNYTTNTEKH